MGDDEVVSASLNMLPLETRAVVMAIDNLANEVRALREAWLASPGMEMSELALAQVKAQLRGGIVAAGGIIKPNH